VLGDAVAAAADGLSTDMIGCTSVGVRVVFAKSGHSDLVQRGSSGTAEASAGGATGTFCVKLFWVAFLVFFLAGALGATLQRARCLTVDGNSKGFAVKVGMHQGIKSTVVRDYKQNS